MRPATHDTVGIWYRNTLGRAYNGAYGCLVTGIAQREDMSMDQPAVKASRQIVQSAVDTIRTVATLVSTQRQWRGAYAERANMELLGAAESLEEMLEITKEETPADGSLSPGWSDRSSSVPMLSPLPPTTPQISMGASQSSDTPTTGPTTGIPSGSKDLPKKRNT
jgi:hypothetical protein